nr:hypothetical protein [Tanacetum cinerariifolium]
MYKEYLAKFWYSAKALENSKVSFSIPTGGIIREVGVNTFRNARGTHYLPHSSEYVAPPSIDVVSKWFPMIGYGEEVLAKGTLRKSLLPPRWSLLMAHIIQCLGVKTRRFDQITKKDAIILYSLANGINIDYANIFLKDIIIKLKKKQREKVLKPNQPEEPPFTDHMLAICAANKPMVFKAPKTSSKAIKLKKKQREKVVSYTRFLFLLIMHKMKEGYGDDEVTLYPTQIFNKPVVFKAPKTSSKAESVSQGTKLGAQTGHKKPLTSSKQPSVSSKEATKGGSSKAPTGSKIGHSKRRKESSSTIDSNPSQPLVSTPVDTRMHKEDQQETGGPTSLGHLSLFTLSLHQEMMLQQLPQLKMILEILLLLEDLAKMVSHVQPSFKDLDLPEDDVVIIVEDSDEDKDDEVHATKNVKIENTSVPKSSSLRSSQIQELTNQLNELLVKSLKSEFSKILSTHDFSSSLPTELNDLPSKFNDLTREVKGLKYQVHNLEIELLGDLKEIPPKMEDFTKTVTRGSNKDRQGQKGLSKDAEEESTKSDSDDEITHVPGSMVESSKKKELKRRAKSIITNCDILTRKSPITLKVYREDDTSEIIPEFKASDLHLGLDDHARTFSSLLLAEIDKRNLNPLNGIETEEGPLIGASVQLG